jgi:nitrogen regulatory protein PII
MLNTLAQTTTATLVTIVAPTELLDEIKACLDGLGTRGYTVVPAEGHGLHGARRRAFLVDIGNVRIETLLDQADAQTLLGRIAREYADRVLAFSQEVQALPRPNVAAPANH